MLDQGIVKGSCHHDCPDTCVWNVTVSDGRAVSLRGDPDHPTTRGQLCPKVNRFLERVYHPDRVLRPLLRVGPKGSGEFRPIDWDEAVDRIADRLGSLRADGRSRSILPFSFDGTQGVIQKGIVAERFFARLGASDIRRHLCGVTAWLGAADVSGEPFGVDPEALVHARTIVLWGTNTYHTNRHLWPVIEEARAAGAQVIVVDPVRTATAARADVFLQLRPGTDVALVLGVLHVLDRDGLLDHVWLDTHTTGWDELAESARAMPPATAAEITGVACDRIEWLAHRFATVGPSVVRSLVGAEHRADGRETMRALALLPAVTGAWNEVGGGLARSTQIYFETALAYPEPPDPPVERRTFNMAELGRILTDSSLDPAIEALIVHNSNPAVICPDQNRVLRGLEREDLFTVVIEQFVTDTARYADVVLPATTQLEHLDLGIAWGHLYLSLNRPAIEPRGQARPNSEIFRRLAAALDLEDPMFERTDEQLIRDLLRSDHPWMTGITYERLEADAWARLAVPSSFRPNVDSAPATDDGRLRLGPLAHRGPRTDPDHRFMLISRKQHLGFLNANYGGFPEHYPAARHPPAPPRPCLEMHPDDARAEGLAEGDPVRVHNDRGALTVAVTLSTDTQPGLVALPFGWWNRHTPEGRSVNALTNPEIPADGQGSAAFHDTWVSVTPAENPIRGISRG